MRSTPPRASTPSSVMSNRRYLKLVLPRFATRIFMTLPGPRRLADSPAGLWLLQEGFEHGFFRPRDDVGADQLAIRLGGLGAGVHGGADRPHVATHERRHIRSADLHLAGERDVGGLAHGVRCRNGGDQPLGLNQTESVAVAVAEIVTCHRRTSK